MNLKKIYLPLVVAFWTIAVGIGIVWTSDYASRPGRSGVSPPTVTKDDISGTDEHLPKLLLFLHPFCACSRATLAELGRLTARDGELIDVHIFFYLPSDQSQEWAETETWHQASEIPNVNMATMSETDMHKFGALTSGQILLYDKDGNLIFSGGITVSRGHEGDNAGIKSIEKYLRTGEMTVSQTPVFGCVLTTLQ